MVRAKICGLNDPASVAAGVEGGAAFVGFVFYPPSPRAVTPAQAAALATGVPPRVTKVGLFVDADDATLAATLATVALDMVQLHGGETPERVTAVRRRHGLPVMKALKIAAAEDVARAAAYETAADWLLFDAKPPTSMTGALPGGNALAFDWRLVRGQRWRLPWMLSGGLDAGNVAEAVAISGASAVDVSSGVERRPGEKDTARISAFLGAVAALGDGNG
ncbi:MAG: phosphoribosylanthranilate isomerase [Alphaproteobacteria bacterium]|nr:phosphoribosylanthranilate isomerase [Alphaproteobacteria bacterium]